MNARSITVRTVVGEAIAGMNLAEPVRQGLTTVAGTLIGAAAGGADGAAAAFNQTALNYVSHSPFAQVNHLHPRPQLPLHATSMNERCRCPAIVMN